VAAADGTSIALAPGAVETFGFQNGFTHVAAICASGTGTLRITSGEGGSGSAIGPAVAFDSGGALAVSAEGRLQTYAALPFVVPAASATDLATIYGSATKLVKVRRVTVSLLAGSAAAALLFLVKRSTVNTGGTSTAATRVPMDSTNAAATATVLSYSANPAGLGTSVGVIGGEYALVATSTTGGQSVRYEFGGLGAQPLVLRGVAEGLAINANGVTFASGALNVLFEWTEE